PLSRDAARALLRRLRCWPLLAGHRGSAPLDVEATVDAIVRIGGALAARPDLDELEVNPLIVGPDGAVAVDVLVCAAADPAPPARTRVPFVQ
ncbi:MAG: acetate--CoA ligase family protein, partial [Actinomycetota bacterium]|nr:acetate--CoA ligase family protein [Actinomycetota bacterium]